MTDLKPCPFCGEKPLVGCLGGATVIRCSNPRCGVNLYVLEWLREKAVATWNRRHEEDTRDMTF